MRSLSIIFIIGLIVTKAFASVPEDSNYVAEKVYGPHLLATTYVNPFPSNNLQYYNNWSEGIVLLNNGSRVRIKHLRYNSFVDELLWLRPSDYQTSVVMKSTVNEFIVFDEQNKPCYFKKEKYRAWYMIDSSYTFLQVLVEGNVSFYAHRRVLNVDKNSKELVKKDLYYVKLGNQIKLIKLSRYSIYNSGLIEKEKMRDIIRENHLRVRREEDMMKAIDLYNAAP